MKDLYALFLLYGPVKKTQGATVQYFFLNCFLGGFCHAGVNIVVPHLADLTQIRREETSLERCRVGET